MLKKNLKKLIALVEGLSICLSFSVVAKAQEQDIGPWEFFVGENFDYVIEPGTYYYDTAEFTPAVQRFESNVLKPELGGNICYATDKISPHPQKCNYMRTMPDSIDNRLYVYPSYRYDGNNNKKIIGATFNVPEDALWIVEMDALNKGTKDGVGSGNSARICVLEAGETLETPDNCTDVPVRKKTEAKNGYYKSDIMPLEPGCKIMMRVGVGKDNWGDNIYLSYKIHKVNVKGEILETYDLNQAGVETKKVINPNVVTVSDVKCNTNDWLSYPKFGPWEFYGGRYRFYEIGTWEDRSQDVYFSENPDELNPDAFYLNKDRAVYNQVVNTPIKWRGKNPQYLRTGIAITDRDYNTNDWSYYGGVEIYPGSLDKNVRITSGPIKKESNNDDNVIVKFNVPVTGEYKIHTDIKNYGWLINGKIGYGTGNLGRITILKGVETEQTAQNTAVFKIPSRMNASGNTYESENVALTAGDRIYLEVQGGHNGDKDDFMGHYIIDRYENGQIVESYNLGDVNFSDNGNWNMFYSNQGETNQFYYSPLVPASGNALKTSAGFHNYAAKLEKSWGKFPGTLSMLDAAPSVGWGCSESELACRMLDTDIIVSYDIPKTGAYVIKTNAKVVNGIDSTLTVSKSVPYNTIHVVPEETLIKTVNIGQEKVTDELAANFNEGERIYFKLSKGDNTTETIVKFEPQIMEVKEEISVTSGGINVVNVKNLSAGSKIDVVKTTTAQNGKMILALYETVNGVETLRAATVSEGSGTALKTFEDSIVIPEGVDMANLSMKVMVWDFGNLNPLKEINNF